MWPKDSPASLDAFYTRPDGSARWEVVNLTYIPCPWKIYTSWDPPQEYSKGIRIHKKAAPSLSRALEAVYKTFNGDALAIKKVGMDRLGGSYFFRPKRGSRNLSLHAYGAAVDFDPIHNEMRRGNRGLMNQKVIQCFEAEGWTWGGSFGDPMHFQATDNGKIIKPIVLAEVKAPADWMAKAKPIVKRWEGMMSHPYDDVGHLAIGHGHTNKIGGYEVRPDSVVTIAEADAILEDDLNRIYGQIAPAVETKLAGSEGGAVLSFCYNLGPQAFLKSTMLKKINAQDLAGAADEFLKWTKSNGKVMKGLTARREDERKLFLS